MVLRSPHVPLAFLVLALTPAPLLAQSITAAGDGTGTQVVQEGDRYTITGGSRSRENLFHSFERLGLSADEMATFLSQPDIANILGRVTGGDASIIDGLLQVTGGNSNLYLINPAGMVFGPNARLDVSGSFFATTATGIGFGENWFNAMGDNTYGDLVGEPDSFAFSLETGGSLVNLADLTVPPGEAITLLGGTVTNTGTLTAPGGTITLAAVPGQHRVRLSQAGSVLSLELEAANGTWDAALNPVNLSPLTLPALLTGGGLESASQITVNPDGTVRLAGMTVPVQDGTVLVSGTLDAAGTGNAEINGVGDRIALLNATLDASGTNGGGTIRIGGDYHGEGSIFNATHTYTDAHTQIRADALEQGNGGQVVLWADGNTQFAGTITARGGNLSGNGGFVEVSGAQNLLFNGLVDVSAQVGQVGTLLLDPANITISGDSDSPGVSAALPEIFATELGDTITINSTTLENQSGNIVLEAFNNITVDSGLLLSFVPGGSITLIANAADSGAGDFTVSSGSSILTNGRDISISGSNISLTDLNTSAIDGLGDGGAITLTASGNITTGDLSADSFGGDAGAITLTAGGGILTTNLSTTSFAEEGNGGDISLTASTGNISTGDLASLAFLSASGSSSGDGGNGGDITLTALSGDITTGIVDSSAYSGPTPDSFSLSSSPWDGTGVSFSTDGSISTGDLSTATYTGEAFTSGRAGDGGSITFDAGGDITTGTLNATAFSLSGTAGNAGTVSLTAGGNITVGDFASFSDSSNRPEVDVGCEVDCGQDTVDDEVDDVDETSGDSISVNVDQTTRALFQIQERTGISPALIYVGFVSTQVPQPLNFQTREAIASQQVTNYLNRPNPTESPLLTVQPQDTDELELLLVLPNGDTLRQRVEGVTRQQVLQVRRELVDAVTAPARFRSDRYLTSAQQLYQWLIAPLEPELEADRIGSLSFILDAGLRSLPVSVLHDGHQFVIEKYSVGLMPSLSLTDTQYHDLRDVPILAMGASEFDNLLPLPAVPTELDSITAIVPNSVAYLNQDFTEANFLKSRYERPFGIVHLATHAEFLPGDVQNSFIQFGDRRLPLDALRELGLNDPPVELLVLSACKTALGNEQAELGFGGLAVQTGVRSVLASLWYVSDTGTLAFMNEFYRQLQEAPTRSEALRQTQLALLQGKVHIENDQLVTTRGATVPIPDDLIDTSIDLTHPYFWASFTMIGSPW